MKQTLSSFFIGAVISGGVVFSLQANGEEVIKVNPIGTSKDQYEIIVDTPVVATQTIILRDIKNKIIRNNQQIEKLEAENAELQIIVDKYQPYVDAAIPAEAAVIE